MNLLHLGGWALPEGSTGGQDGNRCPSREVTGLVRWEVSPCSRDSDEVSDIGEVQSRRPRKNS